MTKRLTSDILIELLSDVHDFLFIDKYVLYIPLKNIERKSFGKYFIGLYNLGFSGYNHLIYKRIKI